MMALHLDPVGYWISTKTSGRRGGVSAEPAGANNVRPEAASSGGWLGSLEEILEFPKIRGTKCGPRIIGSLMSRSPK